MARKANAAVEARKLARERRMKLDADRAVRDERIESAAAAVFVAQMERASALDAAAAAELKMAGSVRSLLDGEGLTQAQTAELLDLDAAEIRRLTKLTGDTARDDAPAGPAATSAPVAQKAVAG